MEIVILTVSGIGICFIILNMLVFRILFPPDKLLKMDTMSFRGLIMLLLFIEGFVYFETRNYFASCGRLVFREQSDETYLWIMLVSFALSFYWPLFPVIRMKIRGLLNKSK